MWQWTQNREGKGVRRKGTFVPSLVSAEKLSGTVWAPIQSVTLSTLEIVATQLRPSQRSRRHNRSYV